MQGSTARDQSGVSNCSEKPYDNQIKWEEPLTKVFWIDGVKGHVGVIWGQPEVKLLRNDITPPNLVGRTTTGQIAFECAMVTKFGTKNPWPECRAIIVGVEGHAVVIWGQPDSNCPETPKTS